MKKTLGLALGSGGARGAAHVGFLQALEENGIKPDYLSGSSMGTLVAACYAKGMKLAKMQEILFELKGRDLFDIDILPLTKLGLLRSQKVRTLVEQHLEGATFENLKVPFQCVSVDILSGKAVILKDGNLVDSVLASCAIPSIFRPIQMNGMMLVDGGIANRVPVSVVKNMGADVVIGVDVLGTLQQIDELRNIFSVLLRTIDVMDYTNTEKRHREEKDIIDLWIEPDMGNISQYSIKSIEVALEAGYQEGLKNIKKIKELLK